MAASSAWRAIFWFEVRYQLRQPLFSLVTLALGVLLFIAGTGHGPGGPSGRLHLNAPAVILEQLMKWIYLVLFLLTAFVASAATRDFERRTFELFFSKPITRFEYVTARFAGTMVTSTLPYLVGAGAFAIGTFMPWVDQSRVGSFQFAPYLFGIGVLIVPTLVALGAAFYALASWTRNTLATYFGVVAFFAISATAGIAASGLETSSVAQLLDPFGVTALASALKYATVAELNATTPIISGMLLWNRIIWLGLGLTALTLSVVTFDPSRRHRAPKREAADAPRPADETTTRVRATATRRVFSRGTIIIQMARQVRREMMGIVWSVPFLGILALGLFVLIQAATSAGNLFGMPVHPRTYLMLEALQGLYSVVLLIAVVLYSGEVMWKERSLEMDEIVDSMPTPSGVYLGAKLAALVLVIVLFLVIGVGALIGVQLARGYDGIELGLYAQGVAIAAVYPTLMMVLACFCHVVAKSRLAGYGLVILFIITWDFLEDLGFEHHLYRFASLPATPYSDINGYGHFLAPFGWYTLYWALVALVVLAVSTLLWKRGADDTWTTRLAEARTRFRASIRAIIAVGTVGFVVVGAWIFYNTNVLNAYEPVGEVADRQAAYERLYRKYERTELPRIVAVRADVDIYPERRSVAIRGSYRVRNTSGTPLRELHLSIPERVRVNRLDLPAHDVTVKDEALGYSIYRLRAPLEPGEEVDVGFDVMLESNGFVNHGASFTVVDNGTYFTKREVFPVIGYDAHRELADAEARRQRGLEPVRRFSGVDDLAARRYTPRAPDADRVHFETRVSTSIDQIAVTSGELQREWVKDGRRYFHYRSAMPITHHFAYASARYAVTRSEWKGVAIEVYHHPGHGDNVTRMIDAAKKSIAYFTTNFGPYQHHSLRIVEFPRYVRDATAFPGLVAFSESMGLDTRLDRQEAIDYSFYVIAHEIAHQWWGQQLVAADVQGAGTLHETLAQYSALMVMEDEFGREKMPRVLEHELDWYLRGRGSERGVEPSLAKAERQEYVYYHKGALAMYALRDVVGEERLNGALSAFLKRASVHEPPYPTMVEFLDAIRPVVPEESAGLVGDLFETITMFDSEIISARSAERSDGTYLVRVEMKVRKLRDDGKGVEREITIDDWVDVAVFDEGETTLVLQRLRARMSRDAFEIAVGQRPASVVIDPYYKLIDRNRDDNERRIDVASAAALRLGH